MFCLSSEELFISEPKKNAKCQVLNESNETQNIFNNQKGNSVALGQDVPDTREPVHTHTHN